MCGFICLNRSALEYGMRLQFKSDQDLRDLSEFSDECQSCRISVFSGGC